MDGGSEITGRVALIGDIGGHVAELRSALEALGCDTDVGTVPDRLLVALLARHTLRREPRPARMRGLKTPSASVVIHGHAVIQNLRRGYYPGVDTRTRQLQVAATFDELAETI